MADWNAAVVLGRNILVSSVLGHLAGRSAEVNIRDFQVCCNAYDAGQRAEFDRSGERTRRTERFSGKRGQVAKRSGGICGRHDLAIIPTDWPCSLTACFEMHFVEVTSTRDEYREMLLEKCRHLLRNLAGMTHVALDHDCAGGLGIMFT